MENRFLEVDHRMSQLGGTRPRSSMVRNGNGGAAGAGIAGAQSWATPFSAADRVLVILIDNGGVDLGIPELVDKAPHVDPRGRRHPGPVPAVPGDLPARQD